MLRSSTRAFLFVMLGFSVSSHADTLGPLDGRSPDPSQMSQMSVEAGYVSGDDLSNLGLRLNYQYSPLLTVYGDFSLVDLGNADGTGFGVGVRYFLDNQRIAPELDLAVRASYHRSTVDFSGFSSAESDLSELTVAVHVGGKEAIHENGLKWYGVVSLNRLSFETTSGAFSAQDDDIELGFGGGVYMPIGTGEAYVGVENVDDLYFGIGYRHFLGGVTY